MNDFNGFDYLNLASILDLKKGDTVLIASDITKLFTEQFHQTHVMPDMNLFIDTIINQVGSEGTLLFPTFNWDFCHGKTFNWHDTKGKTGALGNACLKRNDFKRTKHALYSFCVIGKDQDLYCNNEDPDSFGPQSIFAQLDKKNAKQIMIGLDLWGFTFIHYVEQMHISKIDYRFLKYFTGLYQDQYNHVTTKTFSMLVRDLEKDVIMDLHPLENLLIRNNAANKQYYHGIPITTIPNLHKTVSYIENDILNNRSRSFCKFIGQ